MGRVMALGVAALLVSLDAHADAAQLALGRAVFVDRERGHCILCHRVAQLSERDQGNLGPDLSRIGARLTPAQLRARISDPTRFNPATAMPAYYRTEGLHRVEPSYRGQPVLSAQELDALVAWVATLGREDDAP